MMWQFSKQCQCSVELRSGDMAVHLPVGLLLSSDNNLPGRGNVKMMSVSRIHDACDFRDFRDLDPRISGRILLNYFRFRYTSGAMDLYAVLNLEVLLLLVKCLDVFVCMSHLSCFIFLNSVLKIFLIL